MKHTMKLKPLAVMIVVPVMVLLSACVSQYQHGGITPQPTPTTGKIDPTTPPSPGGVMRADPLEVIISELSVAGAKVERGEKVDEPFIAVPGQTLKVNGQDVQVFVFPDLAARETASKAISPDGTTIGSTKVDWVDSPYFWNKDVSILLYVGHDQSIIDLISKVAGTPITQPVTSVTPGRGGLVTIDQSPAVQAAIKALSAKLGIPLDQIQFVSADIHEWSDSCLELGGPAESCLQAVTPGYLVTLKAGEQTYEVHTTEDGSSVRIKS